MSEKSLEKDLLRHAYDNVIDKCARLNAFCGNLGRDLTFEDITTRQTSLAIDDIITLSISARRLFAICGIKLDKSKARVRKWRIRVAGNEIEVEPLSEHISLQKLFGLVIHCEVLEVFESERMVKIHFDPIGALENPTLYLLADAEDKFFSPKALVKSDKFDALIFDVADVVSCIDQILLPIVIEVTENSGIYLESFYDF